MSRKTPLLAALILALALPAAAQAKPHKRQFYVSLGDSYAVGWQHPSLYDRGPTRQGFANQIVRLARHRHHRLKLVNFGCAGATAVSILEQKGCPRDARAIGGRRYHGTQVAAAERFLRRHRRHHRVGLVTISIGGNDVTSCAEEADPITCVGDATAGVEKHVKRLAKRVRRAAGHKVRIVGTTYPDVILGQWVHPPVDQAFAALSVSAFKLLLNPTLRRAYATAGGTFVDVTKATGGYGSLDETTTLDPYGTIPVPVAQVCRLTWYCQFGDIHANRAGYRVIAKLVVKTLPRRKRH